MERSNPIPHHGVDLHGTLAKYEHGKHHPEDFDALEPVEPMVNRVKDWLANGEKVTIFSAAANKKNDWDGRIARGMATWAEKHVGEKLPVTAEKDPTFTDIWDNIAEPIETNTGKRLIKKKYRNRLK